MKTLVEAQLQAALKQNTRVNVDSWNNVDGQFASVNPSLTVRVYFRYWIFVIIKKMMFTCSKLRKRHIKVTVLQLLSSLEDQHFTKAP